MSFILIRSRLVLRILNALTLDTASGPDGIPVRVYRECCSELAPAIAVLVRYLLRIGCWPQIWRLHRIQALFKKNAVSVPSNYRGVHLTNIVSKVVERAIASVLVPYFDIIERSKAISVPSANNTPAKTWWHCWYAGGCGLWTMASKLASTYQI